MGFRPRRRRPIIQIHSTSEASPSLPLPQPSTAKPPLSTPPNPPQTPQVDPRTSLPLYSITTTVLLNLLHAPINIGSDAFISLIVTGYYSSFILAASVRLTTTTSSLPWGPFRLDHGHRDRLYDARGVFLHVAARGGARCGGDELVRARVWGGFAVLFGVLGGAWAEALSRAGEGGGGEGNSGGGEGGSG